MEQRKPATKSKHTYRSFCAIIKNDKGYTYIEITIALSLLLILFPAIFFLTHTLEAEFKKIVARERLQMEYIAFHSYMMREIPQATRFSLCGRDLVADFPTGESIRYEHKKRQIVRSVKKPGETHYLGNTILLQNVYFSALIPDGKGLYVEVGLQNWHASLDLSMYIGKRVDALCGQTSEGSLFP